MTLPWPFILLFGIIRISLALPLESDYSLLDPRASSINCEKFTAGPNHSYSLPCAEYRKNGYPKTIAGRKVHLYHYTNGWDANDPNTVSIISDIDSAFEKTLPLYEGFGAKYDVVVVLNETLPDDDQGDTLSTDHTPCWLWISAAAVSITETIAHEGYHCVQLANRNDWDPDYNGWWSEGVPELYSDVFYPDHTDQSFPRQYQYDVPLYLQDDAAGLFWIFLNGYGWTYSKINNLVFNEPDAHSFSEARSGLSSHLQLRKAFPEFAKAFVDNNIVYNDGSLVEPMNQIPEIIFEPISLPDCGSHTRPIDAKSWTINSFGLLLEPGQSFTITWKPTQSHTTLYYRKAPSGDWTDITSTPATLPLTCEDDPATLEFLFTCTADMESCGGSLTVLQISKLECPGDTPAPSCSSSGPSSCPYGSWELTATEYADFIRDSTPSGVTVSNIDVSGSATFALVQDTKKATLQFTSFAASYEDTDDSTGDTIHYDLAIDGGGTATAVFAADGESFSLASPTYSGKFSSQTTFAEAAPLGPNGDFSLGFGPDVEVVFACGGTNDAMSLNGKSGGNFIYSLEFETASATSSNSTS